MSGGTDSRYQTGQSDLSEPSSLGKGATAPLHEAYVPRYSVRSVRIIALSMLVLSLVNSLITLVPALPTFEPKRGLVGVICAVFGAFAFWLVRRERTRQAVYAICLGLLAAITLFQFSVGNGVRAPLNAAVALLIPFAGLILGRRAALGALLVALTWLLLVLVAELLGFIPGMQGTNIPVLIPAFWLYCALCVSLYALTDNYTSVVSRAVSDLIAEQQARGSAEIGKAEAEAVVHYKDEFLAMLSHEIRTPLAGVSSGVQVLTHPNANEAMKTRAMHAVRQALQNTTDVLNNLLENSKIDAGKLELTLGALSPIELLRRIEQVFAVQAEAKGLRFEVVTGNNTDCEFLLDAPRLTQMLSNLLSNALKFTQSGSISVRVEYLAAADGPAFVTRAPLLRFSVRDTGSGISPINQLRLFKEYVQIRESGYTQAGTGLGLVVVRKLAELMGGTAGVDSVDGEGSTFWFTLRAMRATSLQPVSPVPAS